MASMASTIGKQIPGFMALGLMGHSVGMAKKGFDFKKKKNPMWIMKDSIPILAGVPLIKVVAGQVALIP
jgi:hypothetical protein